MLHYLNKQKDKNLLKAGESMSALIELEFEGLPPTVNHMYRTAGKYRYKTLEARQYQEYAANKIREQWQGKSIITESVSLYICYETSNRRRWDIDNRVKALQDCLSIAGVIHDDMQVQELHVKRIYGSKMATTMILNLMTSIYIQ